MALMVLELALVALTLPVATPSAPVLAAGWVTMSATTDDARFTNTSLKGLPRPSLTVTVMAELPPAVKFGGLAITVESDTEGAGGRSAITVTVKDGLGNPLSD